MAEEYTTFAADLCAFMTGGIGPTQQKYIDKINANWKRYNFIVVFGHAYLLTDRKREKTDEVFFTPCENCELSDYCVGQDNTADAVTRKTLCSMMEAEPNEWFEDIGEVVYDKNKKKFKIVPWKI